jgi:hypothetical protein
MIRGAVMLLVAFALGALAAPLAATAQQPAKVSRIGVLASGSPATQKYFIDTFGQALHEHGYMEGQGTILEYRWAEGKPDPLPSLAAGLVHLNVNVIVVWGNRRSAPPSKRPARSRSSSGARPIPFGPGSSPALRTLGEMPRAPSICPRS